MDAEVRWSPVAEIRPLILTPSLIRSDAFAFLSSFPSNQFLL